MVSVEERWDDFLFAEQIMPHKSTAILVPWLIWDENTKQIHPRQNDDLGHFIGRKTSSKFFIPSIQLNECQHHPESPLKQVDAVLACL